MVLMLTLQMGWSGNPMPGVMLLMDKGITRVLQGCYEGVTRVIQGKGCRIHRVTRSESKDLSDTVAWSVHKQLMSGLWSAEACR